MTLRSRGPQRRFLVPEVVQTSGMDCGPAALKCVLEGFNIPISFGRLREACQTEVDGTSIDALESVGNALGLDCEQVMIPAEHVLLPEARALPALALIRQPSGAPHFVVVWRRHGGLVQLMDPGVGRMWMSAEKLREDLIIHSQTVPAAGWREWAGTDEFLHPFRRQLLALGLGRRAKLLLDEALADPGWLTLAALDASARMTLSLLRVGALRDRRVTSQTLLELFESARRGPPDPAGRVPERFWMVLPAEDEQLVLRGAVLVIFRGRKTAHIEEEAPASGALAELQAALQEPPLEPTRELWRRLRSRRLPLLLAASGATGAALVVEALLLRGAVALGDVLSRPLERAVGLLSIAAFLAVIAVLEVAAASLALGLGRRLELGLRAELLERLPAVSDRYFHSRPTSDMAARSHLLHVVHELPSLLSLSVQTASSLVFVVAAIAYIDPKSLWLALVGGAAAFVMPLLTNGSINERDFKVRVHAGAIAAFYLDALVGLMAVRTHGGERSVLREHEGLVVEWGRAGFKALRAIVTAQTLQLLLGFGLAGAMVWSHANRSAGGGPALLLAYWALTIPALGDLLGSMARLYPEQRNVVARLLELLRSPVDSLDPPPEQAKRRARGAAISLEKVSVRAAGHTLLSEVSLQLPPGAHVAVIGPSGAGKSSLGGLLLGWNRPSEGAITVDGEPLEGAVLNRLLRTTAWVEPEVRLWNRSLLDNLLYGQSEADVAQVGSVIEQVQLNGLLERLPHGLQTLLGDGGGLLSGGQGQRVRLGRAMMRPDARLVLLDEAFRGLDRPQRRELIKRARKLWKAATLVCITHDVSDTLDFERVIVLVDGKVVEDGPPRELATTAGSTFCNLLQSEAVMRDELWANPVWRQLAVRAGKVVEGDPGASP